MKYYVLDPQSHEVLRDENGLPVTEQANPMPRSPQATTQGEQRFVVPAHAAINPPPTTSGDRQACVAANIRLNAQGYPVADWTLVPDHRGERWFQPDGAEVVITRLGDPSLDGLFTTPPRRQAQRVVNHKSEPEPQGWLTWLRGRARQ